MLTSRVVVISDDNSCSCLSKIFFLCLFEDDFFFAMEYCMYAGIFLFFNILVVKILKISIFIKYFLEAVTYRFLAPKLIRKYGIELYAIFSVRKIQSWDANFLPAVACLQGAFLRALVSRLVFEGIGHC